MRVAAALVLLALVPASAGAADAWTLSRLIEDPAFEAFDAASLNLHDFDGDGWPEIVSSNDNHRVYVLDVRSGAVRAEIATTHPDGWNARDINPVSIGDLYGDGAACLVIPNSAAYLSAWCHDGRTLFGALDLERRWEVRVDAAQWDEDFHEERPWLGDQQPSMDGNAFLADVDGEPGLEIFVETDGYPGQFSFTHEGEHRWQTSWWDGNAGAVVADLDADGAKEVVFASDGGVVSCYDARTGKLRWSFDARKNGADPGSITLAPVVGDIAGDKKLELVFAARGATEGVDGSHATWFALKADGGVLWKRSYDWMNPLAYTHPALVDVEGDGRADVLAQDWNTIGHKPGDWETTSRGTNLFALRGGDGGVIWRTSVPVHWSNKDVVVVGDDVILNAHRDGREGLASYDLRTGKPRDWYALPEGWQVMRGPVAAQVDGRALLVVPLAKPDPTPERTGLDVGDRIGALAVIDTGLTGPLRFSANFLHTDAPPPPPNGRLASIPDGGVPAIFLLLGLCALLVRRR